MKRVLKIENALTSLLSKLWCQNKWLLLSFHSCFVSSNFISHSHKHIRFFFLISMFYIFGGGWLCIHLGTTKWSRSNQTIKKCNLTWLLVIVKSMRGSSNTSSCRCQADKNVQSPRVVNQETSAHFCRGDQKSIKWKFN